VHRLVASRHPPVGVFDTARDEDELRMLAELEGLTNDRLRQELGQIRLVPADEIMVGPGCTPIMSAFCHPGPSRFTDGTFGVYYAALAVETELVRLRLAGPDQVEDGMSLGDEQVGDQPAMAPPPERLGTHEARRRMFQRTAVRRLPGVGRHPGRITAEGGRVDAGESLLTGLAAAPAAELDLVAVRDRCCAQPLGQRRLVELRMPARAGKAPDVDQRLNTGGAENYQEFFRCSCSVPNRPDPHAAD
jgi:hypothetical protein